MFAVRPATLDPTSIKCDLPWASPGTTYERPLRHSPIICEEAATMFT